MVSCSKHQNFFDTECETCKQEYLFLKGMDEKGNLQIDQIKVSKKTERLHYKDFSEEKAKQLYEKVFIYYLNCLRDENEANKKAKDVIKKQCTIRNIDLWDWV